tara:strand:- start:6 stop:431 length:426 start_codon:yes stop_codon:yes gene_type:complete
MLYRSGCPMCNALDIVGDKWSLIVIRDLLGGKTTFKDFMNGPEKIASNILSQRLKWLKNHEILDFMYRKNNKKEKCYFLTNKGIGLYPVMSELMLWSAKNVNNEFNDRGKEVIKKLEKDKKGRIDEVIQNYKKIKTKLQLS